MPRDKRIATRCPVQFDSFGATVSAESEDLSQRGVFVRTTEKLVEGAVATLRITLPNGACFTAEARVAHTLSAKAARALGREPGIGFQFVSYADAGDALTLYLNELGQESWVDGPVPLAGAHILVVDPSEPLVARLSNGSVGMHFHVFPARTAEEAFASCLEQPPDVVLASLELPDMDGFALARRLGSKANLAHVPVVLMSEDQGDMTRLEAYRMGIADFIPKPFTDEELCIRLSRVLAAHEPRDGRTMRGHLGDISLGTLLSLLEFERKSGILVLRRKAESARLFISDGRVVQVDAQGVGAPRDQVLQVLDWDAGEFEFSSCEVVGQDQVGMATTALLLEHAKVNDELTAPDEGELSGELDDAFAEFTETVADAAEGTARNYPRAETREMSTVELEEAGTPVVFDEWPGAPTEPSADDERPDETVVSSADKNP